MVGQLRRMLDTLSDDAPIALVMETGEERPLKAASVGATGKRLLLFAWRDSARSRAMARAMAK